MDCEAEIIELLKEIKAPLLFMLGPEYAEQQDIKQFGINVAADIFVEALEGDRELKDRLKSNFTKL